MRMRPLHGLVLAVLALGSGSFARGAELEEARIYIEYNFSGNDLGFHVLLDGEDWKSLEITNPENKVIFEVEGKQGYEELGMTELFFEGAEPSLAEFDLEDLLELFPEGEYEFEGLTVDDEPIFGTAELTHDVPDAPIVWATVDNNSVTIRWKRVTGPAAILPDGEIEIEGYQVLVESLDVTLPASARRLTLPAEFVRSLEPGLVGFEVLAIDASGNQTITEGSFFLPD
jgi:hypothetical protein